MRSFFQNTQPLRTLLRAGGVLCMLFLAFPALASFSVTNSAPPADYLISAVPNIGFYDYYDPSGTYVSEIHNYDACWGGGNTCVFTVASPVSGTYGMVHNDGAVNTSVCTFAQAAAASGPCAGLTVYNTGTFTYPQSSGGGSSLFLAVPGFSTTTAFEVTQVCYTDDASTTHCQATTTQISQLQVDFTPLVVFGGILVLMSAFWLPVYYFRSRRVS